MGACHVAVGATCNSMCFLLAVVLHRYALAFLLLQADRPQHGN
jgi:tellurite resistance protein TehA-like permease